MNRSVMAQAAERHKMFGSFQIWASKHEVAVDGHYDDWLDWWLCYYRGASDMGTRMVSILEYEFKDF